MKTVLLPTDFSANAVNACRYALNMYSEEKVNFILMMHAYKVFEYYESSQLTAIPAKTILDEAREKAEAALIDLKQDLKNIAAKEHSFKTVAHNLFITDAIIKELNQKKVELIIIGSQGHTEAQETVFGSNSLNVIEEIENCPVFSIPANVHFQPPNEIVLANSFKAELKPKDLTFLISLTNKFKAPVRILHIAEEGGLTYSQKENRQLLKEKLEGVNHSFHYLENLSVPLGLYAFTESRESGMIAFVNKKHSFFEKLLLDPLYRNLAHFLKVPVLVLHQPTKTK